MVDDLGAQSCLHILPRKEYKMKQEDYILHKYYRRKIFYIFDDVRTALAALRRFQPRLIILVEPGHEFNGNVFWRLGVGIQKYQPQWFYVVLYSTKVENSNCTLQQ